MLIPPGEFSDPEYFEPKRVFESEGFTVVTASTGTGKIPSIQGGWAVSDLALQMADPREYEAVVLVGGRGAREYFRDKKVHSLLQGFQDLGKPIAALSISPNTLANAGLLEGRNATVQPEEELISNLRDNGAKYTGLEITIDRNIITAAGPKVAGQLAGEIINMLTYNKSSRG